jgi:hypothetical protein
MANDESVRIPVDAPRDVQASFQDVKDALREAQQERDRLAARLEELTQIQAGDVSDLKEEIAPGNFNEVAEETVFLGPVTFEGGTTGINTDPEVIVPDLGYRIRSDDPSLKYSLNGHTHVAGGLMCSKFTSGGDADVFGTVRATGNLHLAGNYIEDGLDMGRLVGTGVGCSVYSTVDRNVANNTTVEMTWNAERFDNGGFWSSGTDLTVPTGMEGWYFINGVVRYDTAAAAGGRHTVQIYKNAASVPDTGEAILAELYSHTTTFFGCVITGFMNLDAADYVSLALRQNTGYTKAARKEETRLTILRLGPQQ